MILNNYFFNLIILKNNNIIDYKNMQIPNPDDEDYFPKLLNIRINFRKSVQYFFLI